MPRGGRRDVKGAQPASGPGPFSTRTDAQKIRPADLDSPGRQYGDRQRDVAAQRAVPLPTAPAPQLPAAAPGAAAPAPEDVMGTEALPDFMFDLDSARPEEPSTAGLDIGPGEGPEALALPPTLVDSNDPRVMFLSRLSDEYGNQDALDLLTALIAEANPDVEDIPPEEDEEIIGLETGDPGDLDEMFEDTDEPEEFDDGFDETFGEADDLEGAEEDEEVLEQEPQAEDEAVTEPSDEESSAFEPSDEGAKAEPAPGEGE